MARTTTTAHVADEMDPWGFGRCTDDTATPAVEYVWTQDAVAAAESGSSRVAPHSTTIADRIVPGAPMPALVIPVEPPAARRVLPFSRDVLAVAAVFGIVVLGQAFYIGYTLTSASTGAGTGDLVVSSHPSGLQVVVDGRVAGTTPLVAAIAVGRHAVEVVSPLGIPESFDADIVAGEQWSRHVVLARASTAKTTSALRVDTGRTVAQVLIDGELAGSTPLVRSDLIPGDHTVRLVFARGGTVDRRVTVPAGEQLSLVVEPPAVRYVNSPAPASAARSATPATKAPTAAPASVAASARPAVAPATPAAPATGWVRVESPFEVEIFEQGQLVGTSATERLALSAGGHALELVNTALGYRVAVKAVVLAGKTTAVPVETPRAVVHVNAQPWAEVLVNGRALGETPLANVMLPIGTHQVVFRHPEFGERTQTVTVRAGGPNRFSLDLRK